MKSRLNIFLVLYNDAVHVPRLVNSLRSQSYQEFSVWALNNCSQDNSAQLLKELLPSANIVNSEVNLGYAGGNNLLLSLTAESGTSEYVCILNTDIELDENFIEESIKYLDNNDHVSGFAPVVYYGKDNKRTDKMQCMGIKANFNRATAVLNILSEIPDKEIISDGLPGCSFIFRTEDIPDQILFPSENFMYGEELDLAYRCHINKLILVVSPKVTVWHYHNWSPGNKQSYIFQYYYMMRNRILFFNRYKKYVNKLIFIIKEIVLLPLRCRWLNKLAGIALIKAYYQGLWDGIMRRNGKVIIS